MNTGRILLLSLSVVVLCFACPTIPNSTAAWPKNTSVTVYIDPSVNSQKSNISTAFSNWSGAASTGVKFTVSSSSPPNPQPANSWIVKGTSDPNSTAATTSWDANQISKTTTTFPANAPTSVAERLMAHEIGHTFHENDCTTSNCVNQTVMEKPTTDASATGPTSCDVSAVSIGYGGGSGGGGGGGGGGCVLQQCGSATFCPNSPCGNGGTQYCCTDSGGTHPCCTNGSPIIIDTADQGFHLTGITNGVHFRETPGYAPVKISWTDPTFSNGWLALDRNGNGTIDDLTELFGNYTSQPSSDTPNGFLALAVFDAPENGGNGNGVIDEGDSVYGALRVWVDKNHDGISQPSELYTLPQVGILSIDLQYSESRRADKFGNQFRYRSRTWRSTQQALDDKCYDVFLTVEIK